MKLKTKPAQSVTNKLGISSVMLVLYAFGSFTGSMGMIFVKSKPKPHHPVHSPPLIRFASKNVPSVQKEIRFIIIPAALMTNAAISDLNNNFFIQVLHDCICLRICSLLSSFYSVRSFRRILRPFSRRSRYIDLCGDWNGIVITFYSNTAKAVIAPHI